MKYDKNKKNKANIWEDISLDDHEQNLLDRKMTQETYDALPDYEQRLVDKGLPTLQETNDYRKTVRWVPYDQYMEKIFHHCPGRQFDEFNMGQPIQGMTFDRTFEQAEVMVPFKCDVHGWMNSYIGVLAHPYFAVTGETGMFDISTLPPGDYVLEAWHESLGTQTQNVTVATGQTAEVSFTFAQ